MLCYTGDMPEGWMLVAEAAAELGLTRWGVWRLMNTGQLPYVTQGKFRFVRTEDVATLKATRPTNERRGRPRKAPPA